MKKSLLSAAAFFLLSLAPTSPAWSESQSTPKFDKVMIVILENANYADAIAQPFMGMFAKGGALLSDFRALSRPSLPNYIALTAGTVAGTTSNDPVSVRVRHIGDLLEARRKTWKVYAEGYPGNCFLGDKSGNYVRHHVPFLSFENIQTDARRCGRIVAASTLNEDAARGALPDYSLYIPDQKNNGHDTNAAYADRWLERTFAPLRKNSAFMKGLLLVVTFDEAGNDPANHIYTALAGESVLSGSVSTKPYNHYSLLRTVEDAFALGTLGKNDALASSITGVWK